LFAKLGEQTKKAVIITEGVVAYLTNEQAFRLSQDLFAISSFQYWIMDFRQGKYRRSHYRKGLQKMLKNTPLRLELKNPLEFFSKDGWRIEEKIFILDEAGRVGRKMPFLFPWSMLMYLFPKEFKVKGNKTYGYVMFGK